MKLVMLQGKGVGRVWGSSQGPSTESSGDRVGNSCLEPWGGGYREVRGAKALDNKDRVSPSESWGREP